METNVAKINWYYTSVGIIGLVLAIIGNLLSVPLMQKFFYFSGGSLLLLSAILEKNKFFSILQTIMVAGVVFSFLPLGMVIVAGIPVVLSLVAMVYFVVTGEFKKRVTILGCLGLLFLAIGCATLNSIMYFLGGLFLIVYSWIVYRQGARIGLLFCILNAFFAFTAAISVYKHYFLLH